MTATAGNGVQLSVEEDGIILAHRETILAYEAVALLLQEYEFDTLLDVGSGEQEHSEIFRAFGKSVTTLDSTENADIGADFLAAKLPKTYDVLFCSHVAEHQRNLGAFFDKLFDTLPDGGILVLTTPPECTNFVSFSHCNWLNAGMLLYHLIMAGFDCREARVLTYGYNVSVVLRKKPNGIVRRSWACWDELEEFLPPCIPIDSESCQFNGAIQAIDWDPVLPLRPRAALATQVRELTNSGQPREALALLADLDLDVEQDGDILYHAGVCMGRIGRREDAIRLVKRAAENGFLPFWCAYHLGLFELEQGRVANAAFYLAVSLLTNPGHTEIHALLNRAAPDLDVGVLCIGDGGVISASAVREAAALGEIARRDNRLGTAAVHFATALLLDPERREGLEQLLEIAPGLSLAVVPARVDGLREN